MDGVTSSHFAAQEPPWGWNPGGKEGVGPTIVVPRPPDDTRNQRGIHSGKHSCHRHELAVNENILAAIIRRDEPEPIVIEEHLDYSSRHVCNERIKIVCRSVEQL